MGQYRKESEVATAIENFLIANSVQKKDFEIVKGYKRVKLRACLKAVYFLVWLKLEDTEEIINAFMREFVNGSEIEFMESKTALNNSKANEAVTLKVEMEV